MFNQTVLLNATFRFLWIFSQFNSLRARVLLALGNIRRRALSTSACFRNPVMSLASGPRVLKDKTADSWFSLDVINILKCKITEPLSF